MQMVKLRAPEGILSIVHDGVEVPIGNDRSVDADENTAEVFKVHGFRPWSHGEDAVQIDAVPRSHVVLDLLKRSRRPLDECPAEILQGSLPISAQGGVIPRAETCGKQEQDISSLNRRELFAFLKAKGVSVALPITNEELRAASRRACEG